jgi:hypothetical protein
VDPTAADVDALDHLHLTAPSTVGGHEHHEMPYARRPTATRRGAGSTRVRLGVETAYAECSDVRLSVWRCERWTDAALFLCGHRSRTTCGAG